MHDGRRPCPPESASATRLDVSPGPVIALHDCSGGHERTLGLVGRVAIPVRMPVLLNERAALALELPPLLPVALHAPPDAQMLCPAVELLAWRLVGRSRIELHGWPTRRHSNCLEDWIRRAAAGDLVGDLGGVA